MVKNCRGKGFIKFGSKSGYIEIDTASSSYKNSSDLENLKYFRIGIFYIGIIATLASEKLI